MILRLWILSSVFFFALPLGAEVATRWDGKVDVPARNTIIELNTTDEGSNYQVQIKPHDKVWARDYTFDIEKGDPKLRIRLSPGKYKLRTRSFDHEGYYGAWSGWEDFWIHYKPPGTMFPEEGALIRPKSGLRERIAFEWPETPGAEGYYYILRDAEGRIVSQLKTQNTWVFQELELNAKFSWTVLPLDHAQFKQAAPDPELLRSLKPNHFRVQGPAPGTREAKVHAEPMPRATKYQFEFLKLDRVGERGNASIYENPNNEFMLALAPGTYEVRVRTYFEDKSVSDWSPPWRFFVPYQKVIQVKPKNDAVIDPRDDEATPIQLTWQAQADVHHYIVYIYDDKGDYIKQYKTEDAALKIELPHLRAYRWLVIPFSVGQGETRPPEMPEDTPRFSIGKYIPIKLAVAEEPRQLYTWGRYWFSRSDYEGRNYDGNSLVNQPIYSGTGEGAFGYWNRKTGLGLLGHAGLSGFTIRTADTYYYMNAGLHLGYRYISSGGTRLRVWLGATYMEFPEILRDPYVQNYDYNRIKNAGPQLQVSYMDEFKAHPLYGYHLYGILYQGTKDLGTPNNLAQVPQLSYTLGAFGTYRYDDRTKLQIGYSYRLEKIQYKSLDRSGNDNSSLNSGHYLNLSIEYGIGEYYK